MRPSVARSNIEASDTMTSLDPCTHRIGGFGETPTIPDTSWTPGTIVFSTPRVPGANPGQFSEPVASPG